MTIDSFHQISFVQADIEIGQQKRGLYQASQYFLKYFNTYRESFHFDIDLIGQISELIPHFQFKVRSHSDFQHLPSLSYKYLSEISYLGLLKNDICLNFGGDHSISLATVNASLKYDPNTLVLWVDAHADVNDADHSRTGNFHGMPVQYLLEPTKRHEKLDWMATSLNHYNIIYIGLRDIDPYEQSYLLKNNITFFTSDIIHKRGLDSILNDLSKKINQHKNIHLSFDIDSMDPHLNICTGLPVADGLSMKHLLQIAGFIQQTKKLKSIDIVEINPELAIHATDIDDTFDLIRAFLNKLISPISVSLTKDKHIEDQGDFNDRFF